MNDSVLALTSSVPVEVVTGILQQSDRTVTLPATLGNVHHASSGPQLKLDSRGVVEGWVNNDEWVDWSFQVSSPGTFDLSLIKSEEKYRNGWQGGHRIKVNVAGPETSATVQNDGRLDNPRNPYWPYVISKLGKVEITKRGNYSH